MTIDDTTFALLDTETTMQEPTDPKQEVIEVAVRLYDARGSLLDRYSSLVFPIHPVPPESSAIHHLTDGDLIGQPTRDQVDARLAEFIPANAVIVAHNAMFDMLSLDSKINDIGNRRVLCSERLAHHVFPTAPNFKLQTLRYALGFTKIETGGLDAHRADADVAVLAAVFFRLLELYREKAATICAGDEQRLAVSEQVAKLIAFAQSPYVIERWPMGPAEAKGLPMARVETGLLQWAMKKADISPDLRWNITRELQRRHAA